jgi:predicted RNA-binding Zn ribbon-like protein
VRYSSPMPQSYQAQLVGGHPALDFLNTIHDWTVEDPRDYLATFGDALRFGEAAGVLTRGERRRLARMRAGGELARLRALRERLERIFRACANDTSPRATDLASVAAAVAEGARAARFHGRGGTPLRREVPLDAVRAAVLRLRIADAAASLLTSAHLERVKACPGCGWFFLDASKNRSRRWCSMSTCGASSKSKAYYRRTRRLER